jgi:NADH:ubiquinone oxidoreductase subunit 2 (subunit N)
MGSGAIIVGAVAGGIILFGAYTIYQLVKELEEAKKKKKEEEEESGP